jgi:hypothetical protein
MATKDDKRNAQLFRDTQVKKLVGLINEMDKNANGVVIRGLSSEMNENRKNQILAEVRAEVQKADPHVREWLQTNIPRSYVDGINNANDLSSKAEAGLNKDIQLFKWSGGEKGTLTEKINADFGTPTVGQGKYFALDPNSSSDFGDTLHSFVMPKDAVKLYDSTGGAKTTSDAISQLAQDKMYQEMLKAGQTDFVAFMKARGYSGVTFFSDDGKHKWVAIDQSKTKLIKETPPPKGKVEKLTVETLKSDPNLKPHLQVVNNLLSDAYADFGNTMTGFVKGAENILNEATKKQLRGQIAFGRLEGEGIPKIKSDLAKTIKADGFTVLLDKGGRKWSVGRYAEMLARTHIISANNEAIISRAKEIGVDIVEVSNHQTTTPLCEQFEGKIYSLSGKSANYPQLPEEPPFHPNCKHFLLLRPDLS